MFSNAESVYINNKEVASIVTADGGVLYQKDSGYDLLLTCDKHVLSLHDNDSCTVTGVLTLNGVPVQDETIDYNILHNDTVLDSGSLTTDTNGEISLNYIAAGVGDVDVVFSLRSLLQKTCSLEDLFYVNVDEHTNNGWETIASGIKNLPENFELSVDLFSSGVVQNSEQRLFLCASSTYSSGQPGQAVYVGFNRPNNVEYGFRNGSTDWHINPINNAHTQYHTFKIIRQGSIYKFYVDEQLMGTLNYSNLSNYDDFTLCWINWATNYKFKFKNLKIKALYYEYF